jgi:hypothetical protein
MYLINNCTNFNNTEHFVIELRNICTSDNNQRYIITFIYKPSISKPIRIDLNNWVSSNHNLKI